MYLQLSPHLVVRTERHDRTVRPVRGHDPRYLPVRGHHDDGGGVLLLRGRHGRLAHGRGALRHAEGGTLRAPNVGEVGGVPFEGFGAADNLVHHLDRGHGVFSLGGLPRRHDGVGPVVDGVGHVRHLRAGGPGVLGHALEHLRGHNDRFADGVAPRHHLLLGVGHLLDGYLDAEVAPRDHDAVGGLQDPLEIAEGGDALDLGDDEGERVGGVHPHLLVQDVRTERADFADPLLVLDEGGGDVVDVAGEAVADVHLVLLGHGREVRDAAREVDAGARPELGGVVDDALHGPRRGVNVVDGERDGAVVQQDLGADADGLGEVRVVDVEVTGGGSGLGRGVRGVQGDALAHLEFDAFFAVLVAHQFASTDLRSARVKKDRSEILVARSLQEGRTALTLPQIFDPQLRLLEGGVTKIQPHDPHPLPNHERQHVRGLARGPDGRHDLAERRRPPPPRTRLVGHARTPHGGIRQVERPSARPPLAQGGHVAGVRSRGYRAEAARAADVGRVPDAVAADGAPVREDLAFDRPDDVVLVCAGEGRGGELAEGGRGVGRSGGGGEGAAGDGADAGRKRDGAAGRATEEKGGSRIHVDRERYLGRTRSTMRDGTMSMSACGSHSDLVL
mmetsp:Transcript_5955/g.12469  ORF Transcript_5955/g.12469 Transcript_5955/m.12469 type:complete len:618 (-) Transcript_5955:110-1963(-)